VIDSSLSGGRCPTLFRRPIEGRRHPVVVWGVGLGRSDLAFKSHLQEPPGIICQPVVAVKLYEWQVARGHKRSLDFRIRGNASEEDVPARERADQGRTNPLAKAKKRSDTRTSVAR
jgi:hypothetical protein